MLSFLLIFEGRGGGHGGGRDRLTVSVAHDCCELKATLSSLACAIAQMQSGLA